MQLVISGNVYSYQTYSAALGRQWYVTNSNSGESWAAPNPNIGANYWYNAVRSVSGGTVKVGGSLYASGGGTLKWWAW